MARTSTETTTPPKKKRSKLKFGCLSVLGLSLMLLISGGLWLRHVYTLKPTVSTNYGLLINSKPIDAIGTPTAQQDYASWTNNLWASDEPWNEYRWWADEELTERARQRLTEDPAFLQPLRDLSRAPVLGYICGSHNSLSLPADEALAMLTLENPHGIELLLPTLGMLRRDTYLLAHDAEIAAAQGRLDQAIDDVRAIGRLAEYSSEHGFMISDLVAIAILGLQAHAVLDILHTPGDPEPEQLDSLRAMLDHSAALPLVHRIDFNAERLMMLDTIQRVYTNDGHGGGRVTAQGLRMLRSIQGGTDTSGNPLAGLRPGDHAAILMGGSRAHAVKLLDEWLEICEAFQREPFWQPGPVRLAEFEQSLRTTNGSTRPDRLMFRIMLPALRNASNRRAVAQADLQATTAVLAIHQYRAAHGDLPDTPDQLIPEFPIDPFTGNPFIYRPSPDGTFLLYSTGNDLDDDHGTRHEDADQRHRPKQDGSPHRSATDGDWVIWPPHDR